MQKINIEDIPEWFDPSNYDDAINYTIREWFLQLEYRSWMINVVERFDELNEKEWKDRFDNFFESIKKHGHIPPEDIDNRLQGQAPDPEYFVTGEKIRFGSVRLITCNEIYRYASDLSSIDEFIMKWEGREELTPEELSYALCSYDEYVKEAAFNVYGFLHAQIDLNASDEQIQSDLSKWLKLMREKFELTSVPVKNFKGTDFDKWVNYCVLGFIDLSIWSKYEKIIIPMHIMGQALFPNEFNVDLGEKVRKTIKPLAEGLLSYSVIDALQNQI